MGNRQSLNRKKYSKFDKIPIDLDEGDLQRTRAVSWTWRFISDHNSLWAALSSKLVPNLSSGFYSNDNWRASFWLLKRTAIIFNDQSEVCLQKLIQMSAIKHSDKEIAQFLFKCPLLERNAVSYYISHPSREEILKEFIFLFPFKRISFPEAFRSFTFYVDMLSSYSPSWPKSLEFFCCHYKRCNPYENLSEKMLFACCYHMLLLDIDLKFEHVKNKMTKREFIRNCRAHPDLAALDQEFFGQLYDFVILRGLNTLSESSGLPLKCIALLNSSDARNQAAPRLVTIASANSA